ncbi:MAG: DegQ family serine endoprotease [bacterium]|nr:DegQ family serine endoprotease [bacterium]
MDRTLRTLIAGTAAVALTGAGVLAGCTSRPERSLVAPAHAATAADAAPAPSSPPTRGFSHLVRGASPAVVNIKVTSVVKTAGPGGMQGVPPEWFGEDGPFGPNGPFRGFGMPRGRERAPQEFKRQGSGSGFVISADGVIVTNNHVVEDAKDITVTFADGRELSAKVLGHDPKTDLAVIKVDAHDLAVARLGDSDEVSVGDWVVAIGNPFGLDNTVTAGIVSAKGRAIGAGPYDDFIQTDAPINPGNSGGPLLDEDGNVIGINTAIFSQNGGSVGIGFAIPINLAKRLVPQLEKGHVTRGWLGVAIQKITPDLAESLGLENTRGALVAQVTPKSPAAKAGIQAGDVITTFAGKPLKDQSSLPTLVADTPVGATVPVEVVRHGKTQTVEVTIRKLEEEEVAVDTSSPAKGQWGLALRELGPEQRSQRELGGDEGVLVADVAPDSPAAEAGIKPGDVLVEVNRTPVGSVQEARAAVNATAKGKPLLLLVRPQDGSTRFAALAAR